jgi:hypothetical protein
MTRACAWHRRIPLWSASSAHQLKNKKGFSINSQSWSLRRWVTNRFKLGIPHGDSCLLILVFLSESTINMDDGSDIICNSTPSPELPPCYPNEGAFRSSSPKKVKTSLRIIGNTIDISTPSNEINCRLSNENNIQGGKMLQVLWWHWGLSPGSLE